MIKNILEGIKRKLTTIDTILRKARDLENGKLVLEDFKEIVKSKNKDWFTRQLIDTLLENPTTSELIKNEYKLVCLINEKVTSDISNKLFNILIINDLDKPIQYLFEHLIGKEINEENVKFLKLGGSSNVFQVGEYIVKLGETREGFEIPYSKDIIQPLLREQVKDEKGKVKLTIEVQRILDTQDIEDNDFKKLKSKIKKQKIVWGDERKENVGYLRPGDKNNRVIPEGYGGIINSSGQENNNESSEEVSIVIHDTEYLSRGKK